MLSVFYELSEEALKKGLSIGRLEHPMPSLPNVGDLIIFRELHAHTFVVTGRAWQYSNDDVTLVYLLDITNIKPPKKHSPTMRLV